MKWKNRKMALVMTVLFPYIGLLFALFLDQKCPHCGKYINMAADICPYCAKDVKTGNPSASVGHTVDAGKNSAPESEKEEGDVMCISEAIGNERRMEEIRNLKEQIKSMEKKEGVSICIILVGALIAVGLVIYMLKWGEWRGRLSVKLIIAFMGLIGLISSCFFRNGGMYNDEGNGEDARKLRMLKQRLKELEGDLK